MKKYISNLTVLNLFAAALIALPALSRAEGTTAMPPASADQAAPAKSPKHNPPFNGKLAAVDTNTMTFIVGKLTLHVTSDTKMARDGQPATLADGVLGEVVSGAYRKADDGTLTATTVHFGAKADKKKPETSVPGGTK